MNKGKLITAGIVFGLFAVIIGVAAIVSYQSDKNVAAELTDGSDVYVSVGDIEVTKDELWNQMKLSDGYTYLQLYIEENYIFADDMALVTDDEVAEKIEYYKFGTNDQDAIAELMEDQELYDDYVKQFEDSLVVLGYDPTNDDDLRAFVALEIAKEKVAREYVLDLQEGDLAITDEDLELYYNKTYLGDACAVNVVFNSETEAENLLNEMNLVPNYNLGWGKYFGTEDISTLAPSEFDDTNTNQLDEEEVLVEFLKMYNYMNPTEVQVPVATSDDQLCAAYGDQFSYNYYDMVQDRAGGDNYVTLANYLFDTLNLEDDHARYSFTLQSIGNFTLLSYKVSETADVAFADLTAQEVEDLRTEVLDNTYSYLEPSIVTALWEEKEFEIFDPILKLYHVFNGNDAFDNKGDKELVAKYGEHEITADMLFEFMDAQIGTYYTIEMVQNKQVLNSDAYGEEYGDSYNFMKSKNENMEAHREELRSLKTSFSNDAYATYGFSSSTYSWEEFLILALGVNSEAEAMENLYVLGALRPTLITEDSITYDSAVTIINDNMEDYFSLSIDHILVYIDQDKDLVGDDYKAFVDGLEGADKTEYEALMASLLSLIETKTNTLSLEQIVEEFNDTLLEDPENDWAEYKEYGFRLLTEELGTISSANAGNYAGGFVDGVRALYADYAIVRAASTDLEELYDDEFTTSTFGNHYLYATEGSSFDRPSAEFAEEDDTNGTYDNALNNDSEVPTRAQVEEFIKIEYATKTGSVTDAALPSSVYSAIEGYYGEVFDAYYSTGNYSMLSINYMLDNNVTFAANSADKVAYMQDVLEIMETTTFPEGFILDNN